VCDINLYPQVTDHVNNVTRGQCRGEVIGLPDGKGLKIDRNKRQYDNRYDDAL